MTKNVFVPSTCSPFTSGPVPTPKHSRPILLENDLSHVSAYVGWHWSWPHIKYFPVSWSSTGNSDVMWLIARYSAAAASAFAGVVSRADVRGRMHVATGAVGSGAGRVDCARVLFAMGLERSTVLIVIVSSSHAPLVMDARCPPLEMSALSFGRAPLELGAGIWKQGDGQGKLGRSVGCAGATGGAGNGRIGAFGVGGSGGVGGHHVSKIRLISLMDANCVSHVVDGTFLSAHVIRITVWTIRLSSMSDGCVRYA